MKTGKASEAMPQWLLMQVDKETYPTPPPPVNTFRSARAVRIDYSRKVHYRRTHNETEPIR